MAERVTASDVFEETAFPPMATGRVALVGDGMIRIIPYLLGPQG